MRDSRFEIRDSRFEYASLEELKDRYESQIIEM